VETGRRLGVGLAVIAAFLAIALGTGIDAGSIALHLPGWGAAAPALFVAAFALAILCLFPVLPFVALGALSFGAWEGAVLNVLGAGLGATLAFGAARTVGRGRAERLLPRGASHRLEADGIASVFLLRVLPFLPFAGTSFLLGLTRVRFPAFLTGTLLGSIPLTVAYTFLFARAGALVHRPGFRPADLLAPDTLVPLGLALALTGAALLARRRLPVGEPRS
jgi:uncharacterized membrane protein YdjX (TVP38/TMEM64 family)